MHYKDKYDKEIKGHYIGSYEDVNMLRCQRVEELKSDVSNLLNNDWHIGFPWAVLPTYILFNIVPLFAFREIIKQITMIWRQDVSSLKLSHLNMTLLKKWNSVKMWVCQLWEMLTKWKTFINLYIQSCLHYIV